MISSSGSPIVPAAAISARQSFSPKRGGNRLPTFETPKASTVRATDLKIVRRGKDWLLLGGGVKLALTAAESQPATRIARAGSFDGDDPAAAFPDLGRDQLAAILATLSQHDTIAKRWLRWPRRPGMDPRTVLLASDGDTHYSVAKMSVSTKTL